MNIVLDNIVFFLQRSGGMSVYWYETLRRLLQRRHLHVEFDEPTGDTDNILYPVISAQIKGLTNRERMSPKLLSFLPSSIKRTEKYIYHSSYYRISKSKNAINIVTIHDFIPEMFFTRVKKYYHAYRKSKAIRAADGIVCISNNTLNDLLRFYPMVKQKSLKVIYNGVSEDYYPIDDQAVSRDVKKKYVLFVGKRPPYKNFAFAIKVLKACPAYEFSIVGDKLTDDEKRLLGSVKYNEIANPDNKQLNVLYNHAHCLLYPSSYEGFGIPVIEAMKAGCPVVALDSGAIAEVSGSAALLAKGLDVIEFSNLVTSLDNLLFRSEIVDKGLKNARQFDWDKSVEELTLFYHQLYNG